MFFDVLKADEQRRKIDARIMRVLIEKKNFLD